MERWQPRPLNGALRGRVHESEMPSLASSAEVVQGFARLLMRHVQEQASAISAALPEMGPTSSRPNANFIQLAQAYERFVREDLNPLINELASTNFTGPWSALPDRLRRAAQTHNQFVDRFRSIGVEPVLPDSVAADPNAGSWKPWVLGGMAIAGVGVLGYLLVSAARAKQAFGVEGMSASTMPPIQSFAGARHALRSGTRRVPRKALRGYNLEVEPQHR